MRAVVAMLLVLVAAPGRAQTCTYIVEGARWLWHEDPPPVGWADLGTADDPEATSWRLGCTPFSSTGCGFAPGTPWPPDTTLWLRQHVWLTGAETGLVASIAIDNDFEIWVNGALVSSLVHEGCATRWDAVVPVPDAWWRPGDNVVAVKIIDRGGITNFEMTLAGPSPGACPPGCAQLPCSEPGPAAWAPVVSDCAGRWVVVAAEATWGPACPGAIAVRSRALDGTLLSAWDPAGLVFVQAGGDDVALEARCAHSPTCPVGTGVARALALPYPPLDPGPVLRVRKVAGLARVDWSLAPPMLPGEHYHLLESSRSHVGFGRVNGEGDRSPGWTDPRPFGRSFTMLRVADSCEIESVD